MENLASRNVGCGLSVMIIERPLLLKLIKGVERFPVAVAATTGKVASNRLLEAFQNEA